MKIKNIKHKSLHSSWITKANNDFIEYRDRESYLKGVRSFRCKTLEALDVFSVLSVDCVYRGKNRKGKMVLYVSLPDVITMVEGLYAETKFKKNKK